MLVVTTRTAQISATLCCKIAGLCETVVGEGSKSSADDESVESLPALKDSEFYFILDEEALCVYDHFASVNATHDFRFYREPTAKSVETIYSCHDEDQLELQHGENVFYLHPASTQQVSAPRF